MSDQANESRVEPGDFPFPLTGGSSESCFLTWLRNHSNYMAVRGFQDYLRMAAVLVRGILINSLVVLPTLLIIALVFSLVYGGLLSDWYAQVTPGMTAVLEARIASRNARESAEKAKTSPGQMETTLRENARQAMKSYEQAKETANKPGTGSAPISFFITKKALADDVGWVTWAQDRLGLTPPFLLTPLVLALCAAWVLLFPVVTILNRVAGFNKSLASGSDSSVKWRDRYERSFGVALLVLSAVAVLETLPLVVHYYEQFRIRHHVLGSRWKELVAAATAAVGALSGAPKLLSALAGLGQKLAAGVVALLGLLVPLTVVVLVSDFLIYTPVPFNKGNLILLSIALLLTPTLYAGAIAIALLVGLWKRTFTRGEIRRLCGLAVGMIGVHVLLFAAMLATYLLVFAVYRYHPGFVPDVLLAGEEHIGFSLENYGDLSAYFVLACALEIWLFCWLAVDINLTSIHGFYRDRLASAYLLALNRHGEVDIEEDVALVDICCHAAGSAAPYHLINVALNLQGSRDINLRDRKSDFFIFSRMFIGGPRTGYCRASTMRQVFPQIDLASAMAISAAAASPNMGRSTSPALVAFLTMINVRLGVWIPNPGLLEETLARRGVKQGYTADLNGRKPGFSFDEVFAAELDTVEERWKQLGDIASGRRLAGCRTPTTAHGLAGIAFSGGGIRSATINLGIAQALHRTGMFGHFDYMSTVSGGGYLGSSISVLMRNRTSPVSEIAGNVAVGKTSPFEHIVTVTGDGGERVYRYPKSAELEVHTGARVKPGDRLIRRRGPRLNSDIAGAVSVEKLEGGPQIVRVSGTGPGEAREYRYDRFDEIIVKPGDSIGAGHPLIAAHNSFLDQFRWRVHPNALLREMTMRLDETHRWVNLSDGGHIENLATIELLRRRCRLIVLGDGEADPRHHFNGLATLMRTASIDLGIRIDISLDELRLDGDRNTSAHFAAGRIAYPGETECGYLLYLKSSCTGDEDEVIGEYRHRSPNFPHESTADQFFDEGQFEAYRALGQHIGETAIQALAPVSMEITDIVRCLQAFRELKESRSRKAATA